ncbi:SprB repeat-containing protein [Flavobacterium sp.]|uniref:SprB repeat-containing protein n=1 Tax=Flavobacterium sp. TaxID=239 RepID=UPI00260B91FB|nr:SprB repeat-containing protein [Flavobacterium sp.]
MKKIITFFLLCLAVNSYSQKPKNILLEYNPQSAFLQFVSAVKIFNKNNVLIYEDGYAHYNSFPYNNAIGKKTATLIILNDSDYPLKFYLRGQTLYTNNCNEDKDIAFTLEKYNSLGTESLFACTASADIAAFSLDNPETNDNISSCDVISIKNKKITTYYYKHPISGEWIDIYAAAPNAIISNTITTNDLSLKINEIPDLKDYYGPLFIKGSYTVDGLYDSFVTTQEGDAAPINVYSKTFETNIITYNIIPCSPVLEHDPPLVSNPSCTNTATGSIPLKFKSDIKDDEQLLLNLFINATTPQFLDSKFVPKSAIINKEYTWTNIGAGNYIIKYQAQKTTDNTERVNSSAVTTEAFSIVDPPLFSFSTTEIQPECNGAKGKITITASGGTPPYYYYLNNDPKIEFTSPKIIDVNAGDNYIKVVDSKGCIDNTKKD